MEVPELEGERIVLRRFTPEDAEDVYAYASDPEVVQFLPWGPHRSPQEAVAHIASCQEGYERGHWFPMAIQLRATGRIIGGIDLRIVSAGHRIGEIGYVLHRHHWGHGYMTEAGRLILAFGLDRVGLNRIQALVQPDNRRSIRTLRRMGMTREGRLRAYRISRGVTTDMVVYAIIARDRAAPKQRRNAVPAGALALAGE